MDVHPTRSAYYSTHNTMQNKSKYGLIHNNMQQKKHMFIAECRRIYRIAYYTLNAELSAPTV